MRFGMELPLKYKAASAELAFFGLGRTNVLSSTEFIFTADQPIESGMLCEISIAWPILLENRVRLQLILEATIVRVEGPVVAARISKYNYRTRGVWQPEPAQEPVELAPLLGPPFRVAATGHLPGASRAFTA